MSALRVNCGTGDQRFAGGSSIARQFPLTPMLASLLTCGFIRSEPGRFKAGSAFILFFEPFEYLRCGDRPFRQMRIERARGDVWCVD
jgi:hypothetical protein